MTQKLDRGLEPQTLPPEDEEHYQNLAQARREAAIEARIDDIEFGYDSDRSGRF